MTEPTRRRPRKRYPDEFKREAVELFQQSDVSATQLSTELGVATNLLYRWSARQESVERPAYAELERENRRLRREVEFLKKLRVTLRPAPRAVSTDRVMSSALSGYADVFKFAGCEEQVLCLAAPRTGVEARAGGAAFNDPDPKFPDLLQRHFSAMAPNRVWVTDITEFKTGEGKLYLCIIKEVYDGTLVSWKMGPRATAEFVMATVELVGVKAKLNWASQTIIHSDQGSQYTSKAYQQCLRHHGLRISIGRVQTCADNASAESVFGLLKRELVHHCYFRTRQEATEQINDYFLRIYSPWRRITSAKHQTKVNDKLDTRNNRKID